MQRKSHVSRPRNEIANVHCWTVTIRISAWQKYNEMDCLLNCSTYQQCTFYKPPHFFLWWSRPHSSSSLHFLHWPFIDKVHNCGVSVNLLFDATLGLGNGLYRLCPWHNLVKGHAYLFLTFFQLSDVKYNVDLWKLENNLTQSISHQVSNVEVEKQYDFLVERILHMYLNRMSCGTRNTTALEESYDPISAFREMSIHRGTFNGQYMRTHMLF